MSEARRPGAPGSGPGDDDVVPHPFGSGASAASPAGPADEPPPVAGDPDPGGPVARPGDGRTTAEGIHAPEGPEPDAAHAHAPAGTGPAAEPAAAPDSPPDPAAAPGAGEEGAVAGTPAEAQRPVEPPVAPAAAPRRRRDPMAAVLIGLLTMLLGFAFAVQVRTVGDEGQLAGAREEDLVRILDELAAQEERLRGQLAEQRSALDQLTNSDSRAEAALEAARQRAEAIGILNGTIAARGPGLVMTIRDPEDRVRVADLLDAIQELRGAGAETMQIDDVRVGVSTAVTGAPGSLMVDGRPVTAPYEILAIGSPQDLETAMQIPGGVVQRVNNLGGSVDIRQSDDVVVDALRPLDSPQYASPDTDD